MDDAEANYVIEAVDFVARHGRLFLPQYRFDVRAGHWSHRGEPEPKHRFSLEEALRGQGERPTGDDVRADLYGRCLAEAEQLANSLDHLWAENEAVSVVLEGDLGELQYFTCPGPSLAGAHARRAFDGQAWPEDAKERRRLLQHE